MDLIMRQSVGQTSAIASANMRTTDMHQKQTIFKIYT